MRIVASNRRLTCFALVANRSRDNFPNPVTNGNPYVPVNGPAITDLYGLFNFSK